MREPSPPWPREPSERRADLVAGPDAEPGDEHLAWLTRRLVGEDLWPAAEAARAEADQLLRTRLRWLAALAEADPPRLERGDVV
ncbi:MAG: hypothetical protein WAM30_08320, partial [Candidatus Dormiibacterota bacterium]